MRRIASRSSSGSERPASRGGKSLNGRVAYLMEHPEQYILEALGIELRPYQAEPLARILESSRSTWATRSS